VKVIDSSIWADLTWTQDFKVEVTAENTASYITTDIFTLDLGCDSSVVTISDPAAPTY